MKRLLSGVNGMTIMVIYVIVALFIMYMCGVILTGKLFFVGEDVVKAAVATAWIFGSIGFLAGFTNNETV